MKNGVCRPPSSFDEDVDLGLELGVRRDRAGLAEHLAALEVVALRCRGAGTPTLSPAIALVERLLEHLDAGDDEFLVESLKPTISTVVADLDDAALDAAGADGAAALDREDVLDRHQERLVDLADAARGCSRPGPP